MTSVFQDKKVTPTEVDLRKVLGGLFHNWIEIKKFTTELVPEAISLWHYSGTKFGWSFRISDKKRVLVYLLPRDGFFKVALVFGQKATEAVLESNISPIIKDLLISSKAHAEGRGIRIEVTDKLLLADIKTLIEIKIAG